MDRKQQDLAAWQQWKKRPTPQNMGAVLGQVNPLIQKEVNRWSGTLARPALELEGKRLAAEAVQSYRPSGGAALSTHVANRLKKLSRLSYQHQNVARMPEYQTLKFHTYQAGKTNLEERLGREPTVDELSSELGWPKPYLSNFQRSIRRELVESGEVPPIFDTDSGESGMVDFVYNDLSPVQKQIFEHTTGYGGAQMLRNPQLMKRLNMSQGQLSYQKRLLVDRVGNLTGGGLP
jgi:DNA-directed RNA polymerase specialized sigma subunit